MFTASNGDRADAFNVVIIVTDGAANEDRWRTVPYAIELRHEGVYIVVTSVGSLPDIIMLHSIASLPTERTVFTARQGSNLLDYRDRLFMATCDGILWPLIVPEFLFRLLPVEHSRLPKVNRKQNSW